MGLEKIAVGIFLFIIMAISVILGLGETFPTFTKCFLIKHGTHAELRGEKCGH